MLGLNPLSSAPISDLGALTPITGYISTTDSNDTVLIIAIELDNGIIYTTDSNDTANIQGIVSTGQITGLISTTDSNDTATITGTVGAPVQPIGGDGWTKQEWERYKALERKARALELQKAEAFKQAAKRRKEAFANQIDPKPVAQKQQKEVESKQEVKVDIPSIDLAQIERSLALVERQRQELQNAAILRQQKAILEAQLAIYEAKRIANLDDEEALLLLL